MVAAVIPGVDARDLAILAELEELVRDTYQCWDEIWVGFSWRNYTHDHVTRVRNLARTIGQREGADARAIEFGAQLHDVTKAFDGEILMLDGKRVYDDDGFWINAKLSPARSNKVTDLYDSLDLVGTVHHVSGGQIATVLLQEYGLDDGLCASVREIIHSHLKPGANSSAAGLALYDADTIDANIGLPAFYRNIQITMHRLEQDYAKRGEDLNAYFRDNLCDYLTVYLSEKVPSWIDGKRDDFIAKLTTESGREIARQRIVRLAQHVREMQTEFADFATAVENGQLAIVRRFIASRDNPSLRLEIEDLQDNWLPASPRSAGAVQLVRDYSEESAGTM